MSCTCGSCNNKVSRSELADNLFNQYGTSRKAAAAAMSFARAYERNGANCAAEDYRAAARILSR